MTDASQSLDSIKTIGVLGAGQMGGGSAWVAAATGYQVLLADLDLAHAEKGKAKIAKGRVHYPDDCQSPSSRVHQRLIHDYSLRYTDG